VPAEGKAVLLPHCLIGEKCKARFSKEEGILCVDCKQCRCGEIRALCGKRDGNSIISPSTGFTKRLIQRKGNPGRRRRGVRVRDRKGDLGRRDHPQGGPIKAEESHSQVILTDRYDCLQNDIDWELLRGIIVNGAGGEGAS